MNPTPFQLLTPFSPSHHHIIVAIHHQRVPGAQVHKFFPPVTDLGVQQKDTQLGRWGQGGGWGKVGSSSPSRLCYVQQGGWSSVKEAIMISNHQ